MTCQMFRAIPAVPVVAAVIAAAALAGASETPSRPPDPTPATAEESGTPDMLVPGIEAWLDAHVAFSGKPGTPAIRLIDADAAHALAPYTQRADLRVRGLYDPGLDTVYLVRPWSSDDLHDVGTLVHELTHRRQVGAAQWACSGAEELAAYETQEAWLAERGATGRTNWFLVRLAAQCGPREIHP